MAFEFSWNLLASDGGYAVTINYLGAIAFREANTSVIPGLAVGAAISTACRGASEDASDSMLAAVLRR